MYIELQLGKSPVYSMYPMIYFMIFHTKSSLYPYYGEAYHQLSAPSSATSTIATELFARC